MPVLFCFSLMFSFQSISLFTGNSYADISNANAEMNTQNSYQDSQTNNRKKKQSITLNGTWKGDFSSTKGNIIYVLNMHLTNSATKSEKKFKGTYDEVTEDAGEIITLRAGSVSGTINGKKFKVTFKSTTPCKATFKGTFTVTKTVKGDVILGKKMKGSYSGKDCNGSFKGKGTIDWIS